MRSEGVHDGRNVLCTYKELRKDKRGLHQISACQKPMKENRESTHAEVGIPMVSQKYIIWKVHNRSKMYTSIAELKVHNESSEHGPEV